MSSSQHPIALRLERQVGGATKLLITVMGLPLVDGIFPALVLAGALKTPADIVQVGLLVFGGSATVAVILAEMDGTPREQARIVLAVGVVLIAVAAVDNHGAVALAVVEDFRRRGIANQLVQVLSERAATLGYPPLHRFTAAHARLAG